MVTNKQKRNNPTKQEVKTEFFPDSNPSGANERKSKDLIPEGGTLSQERDLQEGRYFFSQKKRKGKKWKVKAGWLRTAQQWKLGEGDWCPSPTRVVCSPVLLSRLPFLHVLPPGPEVRSFFRFRAPHAE